MGDPRNSQFMLFKNKKWLDGVYERILDSPIFFVHISLDALPKPNRNDGKVLSHKLLQMSRNTFVTPFVTFPVLLGLIQHDFGDHQSVTCHLPNR